MAAPGALTNVVSAFDAGTPTTGSVSGMGTGSGDRVALIALRGNITSELSVTTAGWTMLAAEVVGNVTLAFAYEAGSTDDSVAFAWTTGTSYAIIAGISPDTDFSTTAPAKGSSLTVASGTTHTVPSTSWTPTDTDVRIISVDACEDARRSPTGYPDADNNTNTGNSGTFDAELSIATAGYTASSPQSPGDFTWSGAIASGTQSFVLFEAAAAGTTVTPAVIATTSTLPAATVLAAATVTPSAVATTAALPGPQAQAAATVTPNVVAATSTLPTPTVVVAPTVTPAAVATTSTLPAPAVLAAAILEPGVIATTSTVPTPTASAGTTVVPAAIVTTSTLPTPAVLAAATVTPSAIVTTVTLPTPTIDVGGTPATVTPSAIVTVATLPTPSTLAAALVTPAAVATTAALPTPALAAAALVAPSAVATVTTVPTPTITAAAVVAPAVVVTVVTLPTPTIDAQTLVTVTPAAIVTVTTIPAASLVAGAVVAPAVIVTTTLVPTPLTIIPAQFTREGFITRGVPRPDRGRSGQPLRPRSARPTTSASTRVR